MIDPTKYMPVFQCYKCYIVTRPGFLILKSNEDKTKKAATNNVTA